MSDAFTILVAEDEPGIADFVVRGLGAEGFAVLTAADGPTAIDRALREPIDLIVLDIMLPGADGIEVLARVREAKPGLPVIALTALGAVEDRIRGLDAGAVDYITKPFSLGELSARIRAQLRAASHQAATVLRAGDIELDLITREVRRAGRLVRLSTTEFELLAYFAHNPGRVLRRDQILRTIWGYGHDPATNVVDVYVGYLRRKLTVDDDRPPITTVRSVGYRLDASPARS